MEISKRKMMAKKPLSRPLSAADEDFEEEKSNKNYNMAKQFPPEQDSNLNFITVSSYKNVKDPKRNMLLSKFEEKKPIPPLGKQNSGNSYNSNSNKMAVTPPYNSSNQGERLNATNLKSLESSFLSNVSNKSAKQFEKYEKNSYDITKEKLNTKPYPRAKSKPQGSSSIIPEEFKPKPDYHKRSSEFSDAHYSLTGASTELGSQAKNLFNSLENSGVLGGAQNKSSGNRKGTNQKQIASEEKKQKFELKELLEDLDEEIENYEKNMEDNDFFQREEWKVVKKNEPDAKKKSAYNNPQFKSIALMLENLEKRKKNEVETLKSHVESVKKPASNSQNNSFVVFPNYYDKLVERTFEDALANRENDEDPEKIFSSVEENKRQLDVLETSSRSKLIEQKQLDILKSYKLISDLDAVIAEKERKLRDLKTKSQMSRMESENSSQVTDSQLDEMSLEELRSRAIFITDVKRHKIHKKGVKTNDEVAEDSEKPEEIGQDKNENAFGTKKSEKKTNIEGKDFIKRNKEKAFNNKLELVTDKLPERAKLRLEALMKEIEEKLLMNEIDKSANKPKNSKSSALRQEVSEMRVQEENVFQLPRELKEKLMMIDEQLKYYGYDGLEGESENNKQMPRVKVLREEVELRENMKMLSEINESLNKIAEKERNQELEDASKIMDLVGKLKTQVNDDLLPKIDTRQKINQEIFDEVGRQNSKLLDMIQRMNPEKVLQEIKTVKTNLETATQQLSSMQDHYEKHLWEGIKKDYKQHQSDYLKEMLKKLQEESEQISSLHHKTISFETKLQDKMEEELKRLSDPDYIPKPVQNIEPEEIKYEPLIELPAIKELTLEEYDMLIVEKMRQKDPELFKIDYSLNEFPKEEDLINKKEDFMDLELGESDSEFMMKEIEGTNGSEQEEDELAIESGKEDI